MKKIIIVLISIFCITSFLFADVFVRGYFRSDGTYVRPHYRSNPDGNPWNNWSTIGNVNPYTGQRGYKRPYGSGLGNFNTPIINSPLNNLWK